MSKIPGLYYDAKANRWTVDKQINGRTIRKRLQSRTQQEAELEFYALMASLGVPKNPNQLTFKEAALKYIRETAKRSLDRDIVSLEALDPYIGHLNLQSIHMGTLQPFINARRENGIKSGTVKRDLAVVRTILKLAAASWRDQKGNPFLITPPMIQMPDWEDSAEPYPLTIDEQTRLFQQLPTYLAKMALFAVNTGLREQGVCWLRWDWETPVPEINTSVFITPGRKRQYPDGTWPGEKNKLDQVAVLNRVAKSVIDAQRGQHPDYVFPYQGARITRMHNTAWKNAWKRAGLPTTRDYNRGPHNLKHTFGRRLRNAGVPLETRKALLHHNDGDITTHYSPAEIAELLAAVEKIVDIKTGNILRRAI